MRIKRFFASDLAFFMLVLVILVMSAGGHIVQGDEETMFRVTQNLVERRGLAVSREQMTLPAQDDPIFQPAQEVTFWTTSAIPGRDGLTYSKYGIGQSLAAIPFYVVGKLWDTLIVPERQTWPEGWYARFFVSMLNPVALAGVAWLVVKLGRALGYQTGTSRWIAAAFVFTSMAWPYVKTFYPQPGVAFLVLWAVFAAYRWRQTQKQSWLWQLAIACGAAILFRLSTVIILPVMTIYVILTSPKTARWRWIWPMAIAVGISGAITAWYNWMRFGTVFESGYQEIAWTTPPVYGLHGLLFSPGKGIFFYAPILVLSIVGALLFARKHRPELRLILGLWITYLAFYAPYNFWTGGFNWGPRFLLPVLPIAFLPLGELLENRTVRGVKVLFGVFFLIGFLIQMPAILVDHSRYLNQQFANAEDISQVYSQTIDRAEFSPIFRQWPTAVALTRAYLRAEAWQKAEQRLKTLSDVSSTVPNGQALLYSEFFRRNTLDFWWLHGNRLLDN